MINAEQHAEICETLTVWAAEHAAGCPSVSDTIYDLVAGFAKEYETLTASIPVPEPAASSALDEEIHAELVSLEAAAGLEGRIVPMAALRSESLDDTAIFRCRIPHWGISDYLGLHAGCTVTLAKTLGNTPQLTYCHSTGRHTKKYEPSHDTGTDWGDRPDIYLRPGKCPFCSGPLVASGGHLSCKDTECRAGLADRLAHFVSVEGMAIPGFTPAIVEELVLHGKIHSLDGLYTLGIADFMDACHTSYTDAFVLLKSIERSKLKPLHMLLDGLGIPGLSRDDSPMVASCIADSGGLAAMSGSDHGKTARALARFGTLAARCGLKVSVVQSVAEYIAARSEKITALVKLGVAQVASPTSRTIGVHAADGMDEQFRKQMSKGSRRAVTGRNTGKKRGKRMRRRREEPGQNSGNGK